MISLSRVPAAFIQAESVGGNTGPTIPTADFVAQHYVRRAQNKSLHACLVFDSDDPRALRRRAVLTSWVSAVCIVGWCRDSLAPGGSTRAASLRYAARALAAKASAGMGDFVTWDEHMSARLSRQE